MARRDSLLVAIRRVARTLAHQQRVAQAAQRQQNRDRDKQAKQRHSANRAAEAEDLNAELQEKMDSLRGILAAALTIVNAISFDSLRLHADPDSFEPPASLTTPATKPRREDFVNRVRPVSYFEKLLSGQRRYERELQAAELQFAEQHREYEETERERLQVLARFREKHDARVKARLAEVRQRCEEVDLLQAAYLEGDPSAVITYCSMVLERSQYPSGFPQMFRLAYLPDSKELVIDYEMPAPEIIPRVSEYRYLKTKDLIEEKRRKLSEIHDAYQEVVAGVALRTIHEVLEADRGPYLAVVVFNGFVNTIDPATGRDTRPYLISVRATTERFMEIDLSRVDKKACLRNLGAQVSSQPTALVAVKPLIDFDMVDRRFVESADVLSDLESRPNLMELTPFEFEQLVGNLFSKMGLETKQTRSSRDGGIDVVAFDLRPLIGGKVVIQAKRYRHTVGVSAVRPSVPTLMRQLTR